MPNHITSNLKFFGDENLVQQLIEQFSTHYPSTPGTSYDGDLRYKKDGTEHNYGFLTESTGIFHRRNEDDFVGVPDGYTQDFEEAWTRFPDFAKAIPPPDDDAYNDKPTQQIAEKSPNWWYNWNIKNWGTKWNCYSCKKISDTEFKFQTAWSGVPKLIIKIAEAFPTVKIEYKYADEDTGSNVGSFVITGTDVWEKKIESQSKEAYELYFELCPEDKEHYQLVGDKYEYVEEEA